jgi:hypothetical protein
MRISGQKVLAVVLVLTACSLLAPVAMADSVSFASSSPLTLSSNGAGGIGFAFSPATVSAATPGSDSLNFITNIPFLIGGGIVLDGVSGSFSPSTTSVTIGSFEDSGVGLFSGNINFINISNGANDGDFTISISLTDITYSCIGDPSDPVNPGCASSGVLSQFALGNEGFLNFSFTLGNGPQNLTQLLQVGSNEVNVNGVSSSYSSDGFSGTINTEAAAVPEPASLALFGSGLLAGANFIRRKTTR